MKEIETSYLTLYYNMVLEWERNNITIDTASETQIANIQELQAKAIGQSGLTLNELSLIIICRKYRIFKKVNTYAKKQIQNL